MISDTVLTGLDELAARADLGKDYLGDPYENGEALREFTDAERATTAYQVLACNHLRPMAAALNKTHGEVIRVLGGDGLCAHDRVSLTLAYDTSRRAFADLSRGLDDLKEAAK